MESSSYFILWPNDWCTMLEKAGEQSELTVMYGGPHTSVPPLGKVSVGDFIYPVRIKNGCLFVLGRMQVSEIKDADTYLALEGISRVKGQLWDTYGPELLKLKPHLGHRVPRNCVDHAALGHGTAIRFDCMIPVSVLQMLQLGLKGKEKPLPLKDGKVSHVNLQGHYRRLSDESAQLIEKML